MRPVDPHRPYSIVGDELLCRSCPPTTVTRVDGEPVGQGNARAIARHVAHHARLDAEAAQPHPEEGSTP